MKPFFVYLAGPIAGCSDAQANDWRTVVKQAVPEAVYLDPMRRDYRGLEIDRKLALRITEGDKADIKASNLVLAYCPFPSVGTSMEVHFAGVVGKTVITVVPEGKPSPWLMAHSYELVTSLDEAIEMIRERAAVLR